MKTTYHYLKMLCLVMILAAATPGRAQSPCTPTLTYSTGLGGTVNFTVTSSAPAPPGFFKWSFYPSSSGYNASTNTNTVYTFPSDGPYYVSVTYSVNGATPCTGTATDTVVITNAGCNLNADFSLVSAVSPTITFSTFNKNSTGMNAIATSTCYWGDGTSSTGLYTNNTTTHVYPAAGVYVATLTIDNNTSPACVSTKTLLVNVPYGPACSANASFTMSPSGTPQVWNATPLVPGNITNATWIWGDGSTSNTLYTSHTYSAAGTYSICLTVTVNCGDADTSCFSYAIYRTANPNEDMNVITVQVLDPLTVGIKNATAQNADYSIVPNPGNGLFQVSLSGLTAKEARIAVYNVAGMQVYATIAETANGSLAKEIDLKAMPEGVYFIQVNSGGNNFTRKVIVQK